MDNKPVSQIFQGAKGLSGSPLGIIALFILLVYGFAALVFGLSVSQLGSEKVIMVWFLVSFPVLVLVIFSYLVIAHHQKLYGPGDFVNQADFLKLQEEMRGTRVELRESRKQILASEKNVRILKEVLPVAVNLQPVVTEAKTNSPKLLPVEFETISDDPQKNRWGGQREAHFRLVKAGQIKALQADSKFYRVPLDVISTDPENHPLTGIVRFHLHHTFFPRFRMLKPSAESPILQSSLMELLQLE